MALAAGCLVPQPVRAGAWPREEGRTLVIFSGLALTAPRRFDRRGRTFRAGRFSKQETAIRAEHGFSDRITLIAGGSLRSLAFAGAAGTERTVSGALLAGARVKLWGDGASVLSLEATASAGGERSLPGRLRAIDAPAEADLRLLYGHGFSIAGMPAFAEAQVGWRWRGGRNADELRLDATIGLRPLPQLLVLLQSFNAIAVQGDRRFGGGRLRQHKLQPSLVWDISERWSLQVGAFASLGGREAIQERGIMGALWWRF